MRLAFEYLEAMEYASDNRLYIDKSFHPFLWNSYHQYIMSNSYIREVFSALIHYYEFSELLPTKYTTINIQEYTVNFNSLFKTFIVFSNPTYDDVKRTIKIIDDYPIGDYPKLFELCTTGKIELIDLDKPLNPKFFDTSTGDSAVTYSKRKVIARYDNLQTLNGK